MKQLTDREMLKAAQEALAAHMATRPATSEEKAARAAEYRQQAEGHRAAAARIRGMSFITDPGHGPGIVEEKHEAALAATSAAGDALHEDRLAAEADLHAKAWENASWEETLQDLQARVDYYAEGARR